MTKRSYVRLACCAMLTAAGGFITLASEPAVAQHADDAGARVLAMVVRLATREETLATGDNGALGFLRANGIQDEDIRDGSVAAGFQYCCGGEISQKTRLLFYVPTDFSVAEGDVVEIEVGRAARPRRQDPGAMNRAIAVRQAVADAQGACRWDPEDNRLWMRVIYCDWMPAEGWQLERGLDKKWFKPAPGGN